MTEVTASIPTLRSSSRPAPRKTNAASQWLAPVGLIALSLIPVLAGATRMTELMGSPEITANNARFVASPIPVTVHIVSVTVYSLLGALQFVPSLRRGRPSWHRIAGRILVPAGVLVALSGLWMNFFYPRPAGDGESLVVVRLLDNLASGAVKRLALEHRQFVCRVVFDANWHRWKPPTRDQVETQLGRRRVGQPGTGRTRYERRRVDWRAIRVPSRCRNCR